MVTYLPRSAWGARASEGPVALSVGDVDGATIHWPGMSVRIDAAGDIGKRRVASALRGWQNYHMDSRGWSDIAYCIGVDQAGRAWTLRGLNIRSGANGDADVNRRYGAILLVLGPGEEPTAAMKTTVRGVMADYRKRFPGCRAKPYDHNDVRPEPTDCPGPHASAASDRGEFTAGAAPAPDPVTPETPEGDDEMAAMSLEEYTNYNKALYGPDGTLGKWRQQERDWQGAMLEEAKAQTAAANEQTIALLAIADALGQAKH